MVFALWYSIWVMFAGSTVAVVPPTLALVTRSAYLSRSFLKWSFLVLSAATFLWVSFVSDVYRAALVASQVLAFLALTRHLLSGLSELKPNLVPFSLAVIQHIGSRYFRVIIERLEDIYYTARIRTSTGKHSRVKVFMAAAVSAIAEIVILVNQVITIINARGTLTHPKKWKVVYSRNTYYVMGDITLLALIIILASVGPEYLPTPPKSIRDLNLSLSAMFGPR